MKTIIILEKCLQFSVRVVKLAEFLETKKQKIFANQILRSGTSIGANVAESKYAASDADFINKLKIAEKEACETEYWLRVLKMSEIIDERQFDSIFADLEVISKLLGAIVVTSKLKKSDKNS